MRITEGFLEEMYEKFVGTLGIVCIKELSVWRGSTVGKISLSKFCGSQLSCMIIPYLGPV